MTEATELRTERLLLRPYSLKDVDDVYAYARDETWGRFLPVPVPYVYGDAEEFVARAVVRGQGKTTGFAIVLDNTVIGGIELEVNNDSAIGSLHYSIARQHWGKGLMTEAAQAVTNWGFGTFDLQRVYSWADVLNAGSWRVMEKIGMTREGHLRSHGVVHGERCDFYYYGILRNEWDAMRQQKS
jgi:RimJ/RimL family protein N-acetyltransferase